MRILIILIGLNIIGLKQSSFESKESKIKTFISHFSRIHKNWTQNDVTTKFVNSVFADSLIKFYKNESDGINNLLLRPESVREKGDGSRQIAWEAYRNFADGKEIKVHVYSDTEQLWINKISMGQDYYIYGRIKNFDLENGVGYNRTDNTCDAGILEIQLDSLRNLKSKIIIK